MNLINDHMKSKTIMNMAKKKLMILIIEAGSNITSTFLFSVFIFCFCFFTRLTIIIVFSLWEEKEKVLKMKLLENYATNVSPQYFSSCLLWKKKWFKDFWKYEKKL